MARLSRRLAAVSCLALLLACPAPSVDEDGDAETDTGELGPNTTPSSIHWWLAWDTSEATALDGGGWSISSDLGYAIELQSGWLVNFTATLDPCAGESPGESGFRADGAGDDPSGVLLNYLEDITDLQTIGGSPPPDDEPWLFTELADHLYCRGHYLLAPAGETTHNVEAGGDEMVGQTMILRGTFQGPQDEAATEFELVSDEAWGKLLDLESVAAGAEVAGVDVDVTITRQLGRMFDGVELSEYPSDPEAVTREVLRNLAEVAFEVTLR